MHTAKILFIHSAQSGQPAEYRVHTTLAAHALKHSVDCHFVWQGPEFSSRFIPADKVHFHDFGRGEISSLVPGRATRAFSVVSSLPKSIARLRGVIQSIKPDVIYTSQQRNDVFLGRMMSRLCGIPHALHLHYSVGPWLGASTFREIRRSPHLIAVSEFIRQTALLRGVDPAKVHTIVNPVPDSDEQFRTDPVLARAEFGYSLDTPLVIAVGRLDPGKGHADLFEAFAKVVQQLPSARLLVCGKPSFESDHYSDLLQTLAALKLQTYVTMAGQRSDIRSLMHSADVFCLPTEMDPCPLVFLEASAEGLPSVAYHSGGVPEMVSHGRTGLLSYPQDTNTLATNLLRLLSDRAAARSMGAVALNVASDHFSPQLTTSRWVDVVKHIAASRRR